MRSLRVLHARLHFWWQRKLCKLGRHDLEPVRIVDGWVHFECFYCPYAKASKPSGIAP